MKKAIVIGSGAGGCAVAAELSRCFDVTILEQGKTFAPFAFKTQTFEPLRKAGAFVDERMIQMLFPAMRIVKAREGLVHVNGACVGGTTALATGNALRYDGALRDIGIDLDDEFAALANTVPTTQQHYRNWSDLTVRLFTVFEELGFNPQVTPKFMEDADRCVACGNCVLGCRFGAKWTADKLVAGIPNVKILSGCKVKRILFQGKRACGVVYREFAGALRGDSARDGSMQGAPFQGSSAHDAAALSMNGTGREEGTLRGGLAHSGVLRELEADLVVLAAGGMDTPVILRASGIPVQPTLFVDPVICVAAPWKGAALDRQLPMPFVAQRDEYILSPYFDWLSFFFNKDWRIPSGDIMSIMVKYADDSAGEFDGKRLAKPVTEHDAGIIERSVEESRLVLERMGVSRDDMFLGTLNAGHPGGCLPLTPVEAATLHHDVLPENLYVADASLLPRSMGNPPILTIMALATKVARLCNERFA